MSLTNENILVVLGPSFYKKDSVKWEDKETIITRYKNRKEFNIIEMDFVCLYVGIEMYTYVDILHKSYIV